MHQDPSGYWVWVAVGYSVGNAFGLRGWKLAVANVVDAAIGSALGLGATGIITGAIR